MRFREIGVVVLVLWPRLAAAQPAAAPSDRPRLYVEVNVAGTSSSSAAAREFSSRTIRFSEVSTVRATYPKPGRSTPFPFVDFGGGYRAAPGLDVGVSISRTTFDDPVGFEAVVPHPSVLNAPTSAVVDTAGSLSRRETAVHLYAAATVARTARVEVRIFGGPSYFWYSAAMASDVAFTQQSDPVSLTNAITIDGIVSSRATASDFGLHAGADVAYFVTARIALNGGVRVSRGTVSIEREPLSLVTQDIRVGGMAVFLGARVRIGS